MEPLNNTDKITALIREGDAALKKGRRNAERGLKIVHESRRTMMRTWKPIMEYARANENRAGAHLRIVR